MIMLMWIMASWLSGRGLAVAYAPAVLADPVGGPLDDPPALSEDALEIAAARRASAAPGVIGVPSTAEPSAARAWARWPSGVRPTIRTLLSLRRRQADQRVGVRPSVVGSTSLRWSQHRADLVVVPVSGATC